MLEDVRRDDDIEGILPKLLFEGDLLKVADNHPLTELSSAIRGQRVQLYGYDLTASVAKYARHVSRGAAELEHPLAVTHQPDDFRVSVIGINVNIVVVAKGGTSSRILHVSRYCERLSALRFRHCNSDHPA